MGRNAEKGEVTAAGIADWRPGGMRDERLMRSAKSREMEEKTRLIGGLVLMEEAVINECFGVVATSPSIRLKR